MEITTWKRERYFWSEMEMTNLFFPQSHSSGRVLFRWPLTSRRFLILSWSASIWNSISNKCYQLYLIYNDKWVCASCQAYGLRLWASYTHLLVHVALMVFPGSGRLVDFSFTMDTVIHQDKTPETDAKKQTKTPVIHCSLDRHTIYVCMWDVRSLLRYSLNFKGGCLLTCG